MGLAFEDLVLCERRQGALSRPRFRQSDRPHAVARPAQGGAGACGRPRRVGDRGRRLSRLALPGRGGTVPSGARRRRARFARRFPRRLSRHVLQDGRARMARRLGLRVARAHRQADVDQSGERAACVVDQSNGHASSRRARTWPPRSDGARALPRQTRRHARRAGATYGRPSMDTARGGGCSSGSRCAKGSTRPRFRRALSPKPSPSCPAVRSIPTAAARTRCGCPVHSPRPRESRTACGGWRGLSEPQRDDMMWLRTTG